MSTKEAQGADAVVDEARGLHKRLIVLGAAIIAQRTWGEPLKRDESESQDNALADLAMEARRVADALAALSRPAGMGALTDVQIGEAWGGVSTVDDHDTFRAGVRFAEAHHGIRGGGGES
jgi:hypothetical protein